MTLMHKSKRIVANSSVLDRSECCIDREHVPNVLCTLGLEGIASEAASKAENKASEAADAFAQKQAHLSGRHTLELFERCIDLERVGQVARSLIIQVSIIQREAANRGTTKASAGIEYSQATRERGKTHSSICKALLLTAGMR